MNTIREELIEAQKTRSDLLKWKLLIVAGIGGTALGFSGKGPGNAHLALAVLPLACVYIDLLCRNLSLRIKVIGLFIGTKNHAANELRAYEHFYREINDQVWKKLSLESLVPCWSTVLVCIIVAPVGILAGHACWQPWSWPAGLFYSSSLAGLCLAWWIEHGYEKKVDGAIAYTDSHYPGDEPVIPAAVTTSVQQAVAADNPAASNINEPLVRRTPCSCNGKSL